MSPFRTTLSVGIRKGNRKKAVYLYWSFNDSELVFVYRIDPLLIQRALMGLHSFQHYQTLFVVGKG